MALGIDLDHPAGVIGMKGNLPMRIYMYKDRPGVYYGPNGQDVSEDQASMAGFDIVAGKRASLRQKLLAEKRAEVEEQMREIEQKAEVEIDKEMERAEQRAANAEVAKPAPPPPVSEEPKAASPVEIVRTVGDGEPRETSRRIMEHEGAGRWVVKSKETNLPVHDEMTVNKEQATALLLEQGGV